MGETAAMLFVSAAEGRVLCQLLICSGEEPLNQLPTGTLVVSDWPLYRVLGDSKLDFLHVNNMKTGRFTTGIFSAAVSKQLSANAVEFYLMPTSSSERLPVALSAGEVDSAGQQWEKQLSDMSR